MLALLPRSLSLLRILSRRWRSLLRIGLHCHFLAFFFSRARGELAIGPSLGRHAFEMEKHEMSKIQEPVSNNKSFLVLNTTKQFSIDEKKKKKEGEEERQD
jgi:hypothetical protein